MIGCAVSRAPFSIYNFEVKILEEENPSEQSRHCILCARDTYGRNGPYGTMLLFHDLVIGKMIGVFSQEMGVMVGIFLRNPLACGTLAPLRERIFPQHPTLLHNIDGQLVVALQKMLTRVGDGSFLEFNLGRVHETEETKEETTSFEKQEFTYFPNGVRVGEEVATIGSNTDVEFPLRIISVNQGILESIPRKPLS
ncbi:hypothetical protein Tco_0875091 [Tanacetum coccineum]|uniref:Uncharacterized protein n=1 Tax=Tanacetum coccineum TaxID=301880 RepID=A0ABQ5BNN2_9ASTR